MPPPPCCPAPNVSSYAVDAVVPYWLDWCAACGALRTYDRVARNEPDAPSGAWQHPSSQKANVWPELAALLAESRVRLESPLELTQWLRALERLWETQRFDPSPSLCDTTWELVSALRKLSEP
jgi:hypothetical protein